MVLKRSQQFVCKNKIQTWLVVAGEQVMSAWIRLVSCFEAEAGRV